MAAKVLVCPSCSKRVNNARCELCNIKRCYVCERWLPRTGYCFSNNTRIRDGLDNICRKCNKDKSKSLRSSDEKKQKVRLLKIKEYKKSVPNYEKNTKLKQLYNISYDDWNKLRLLQNNQCAICKHFFNLDKPKLIHVDHDHITGVIRSLLCHYCNSALGLLKEDPAIIKNMLLYIEKHTIFVKEGGVSRLECT